MLRLVDTSSATSAALTHAPTAGGERDLSKVEMRLDRSSHADCSAVGHANFTSAVAGHERQREMGTNPRSRDKEGGQTLGGFVVHGYSWSELHSFGMGAAAGTPRATWRVTSSNTRNQPRPGAMEIESPGFHTCSVCIPAMGGA